MLLALNPAYGADLVRLLRDGPGLINPVDGRGLIGFPSFHTAVALIAMWQIRDVPYLRWPLLILAGAMVLSVANFRAAIIWWMFWRHCPLPRCRWWWGECLRE